MNWKKEAESRLRDYIYRKHSIEGIKEELEQIEQQLTSVRSAGADGMPSFGGGNGREDALLSLMVKKDTLEESLHDTQLFIQRIDTALDALNDQDRMILDKMYINPYRNAQFDLMDELHCEKSTLYNWKGRALRKFTLAMFGTIEK